MQFKLNFTDAHGQNIHPALPGPMKKIKGGDYNEFYVSFVEAKKRADAVLDTQPLISCVIENMDTKEQTTLIASKEQFKNAARNVRIINKVKAENRYKKMAIYVSTVIILLLFLYIAFS